MSAAAAFHEPQNGLPCPWCEGRVSCERDDAGEPILSHSGTACSRFAAADERQLLRVFADAVRVAPWR